LAGVGDVGGGAVEAGVDLVCPSVVVLLLVVGGSVVVVVLGSPGSGNTIRLGQQIRLSGMSVKIQHIILKIKHCWEGVLRSIKLKLFIQVTNSESAKIGHVTGSGN